MIALQDFEHLCIDRLEDAKILYRANRYEWAFYTSGYVVEMSLKKRICEMLNWDEFPPKNCKEFTRLFKTHDLEILLQLSGIEKKIRTQFIPEWSIVITWNPEIRYTSRTHSASSALNMINAAETLLKNL